MIFQGSNHSYSNFFYKNLSLAEVKEYNFLGNIIDNKGRFKRSAQELSKKIIFIYNVLVKIPRSQPQSCSAHPRMTDQYGRGCRVMVYNTESLLVAHSG